MLTGRRVVGAAILMVVAWSGTAAASDKVVVARSGIDIAFAAPEIGDEAGIWQALGLDVVVIDVPGTRIEQVMISGDADVGLGAGIALGNRLKGVPTIGVASVAGPPYNFALIVRADSPIRSAADLKGRMVAVTTAGSLTDWLVRELSRQQGWGADGIRPMAVGDDSARMAALRSGGIDCDVAGLMQAFEVETAQQARIITYFGDVVPNFQSLLIKASDRVVETKPELLKRFLKGWFETIGFMKSHRDVGVKVVATRFRIDPAAVAKAYDVEMKMLSDDGAFSAAGMDVVARSLVELHVLDKPSQMRELYTDRFVPVKIASP
jgi:NitT/TauT family transport system substrate-binding protein